jgi:hypothetical protein
MINITAAPQRQGPGKRGFKQGMNGRQRAEKIIAGARGTKELPDGSFDRHNDFIGSRHVKLSARRRLDSFRIVA